MILKIVCFITGLTYTRTGEMQSVPTDGAMRDVEIQPQPIDGATRDVEVQPQPIDGATRDVEVQPQPIDGATRDVEVQPQTAGGATSVAILQRQSEESSRIHKQADKPQKKKKGLTRKETREKWISFLIQKEREYVNLLQLGVDAFLGTNVLMVVSFGACL